MRLPQTTGPSEFYLRKRRLAFLFAGLSVTLLAINLAVGFFIETYERPRASASADGFRFIWTSRNHDEDNPVTRVVETDHDLRPLAPAAQLGGDATAVLAGGDDTLLFFGARYSVVKGGTTVRGAALDQPWAVAAAVRDPARGADWLFGQHQDKLVARRRELGTFSESFPVADSAPAERIVACVDGPSGPLVAWRERGTGVVKLALYDGRAFAPRGEFKIGATQHWDVALAGPRVLLVTYDREDRTFRSVGLRVRCCPDCPAPRPDVLLRFGDPILFIGKLVTGVAAAAAGDRLVVAVTRWTSAQAASVSLDLQSGEAGKLKQLHQEPRWRTFLGMLFPFTMLFFSFSLVFLGFTLLKERNQFVLEKLTPAATDGPPPAAILQRAMAFILDILVVFPVFGFIAQAFDLSPDEYTGPLDPSAWPLWGMLAATHAVYGLVLEAIFGWTPGKRILGLRVAGVDGTRAPLQAIALRNVVRLIDAVFPLQLFLGMSFIMATRRRQRLGDLLAKTMVVEDRPVPAPPARPRKEPETVERR
ncbi:MAG TPA: RDD family protein [Planctomycetota bacterium]